MLRNIIMFGSGMVVGGFITIFIIGLMVTAKKGDEQGKKIEKREEYKCKVNLIEACRDTCCMFCLGASECKYSCGGNPTECGQSIKIH